MLKKTEKNVMKTKFECYALKLIERLNLCCTINYDHVQLEVRFLPFKPTTTSMKALK